MIAGKIDFKLFILPSPQKKLTKGKTMMSYNCTSIQNQKDIIIMNIHTYIHNIYSYLALKYIKPQLIELGKKQIIQLFSGRNFNTSFSETFRSYRLKKLNTSIEDLINIGLDIFKPGLIYIFFSQHI